MLILLIHCYTYNRHMQFVIPSHITESALVIFPSLFLLGSCLILESRRRFALPPPCWACLAQHQVEHMYTHCVRSHDSAGWRQVLGPLGCECVVSGKKKKRKKYKRTDWSDGITFSIS